MDAGDTSEIAMINHDAQPGKLDRCQITGAANLDLVIDLGHQPLCDALLTAETIDEPEATYPLRLNHCPESGLAQLDYVVEGSVVFPPSYPYRSGISAPMERYQRAFAEGIRARLGLPPQSLCVDVGSNDGTLLTGFRKLGMRVLGVEPTRIAEIARAENGVETIEGFFTEALARDIVQDYGHAQVITMTNVFAHMATLGEVMRGICHLLAKDGVFVSESHYLLDVLEKNQFDTIYHEHIRTYSLKSLQLLVSYYGLEVFDVERSERYGGNIRVYVGREGLRPVSSDVGELLAVEESSGLHRPETWRAFVQRVLDNRDRFMEHLYELRGKGLSVAGYSCPGRAATLLNFYGVTPDLMPYIGELPDSLKLDMFVPGRHIPVVHNRRIYDERPENIVILAWHYADFIVKRLRADGIKANLILALPEFHVVTA